MNKIKEKLLNCFKKLFCFKSNIKHHYEFEEKETNQFEKEVLNTINSFRESKGLTTLVEDRKINAICERNNSRMILDGVINHNDSVSRFNEVKEVCKCNYASEILAYNYKDSDTVVNRWINSPSHLKQIEYAAIKRFGISISKGYLGSNMFTVIFSN